MLLISQNGCKKDNDVNPDNPPNNELPETTKVITNQDWNKYIVSVDSTDWTLTFNQNVTKDYDLKVGDVLISTEGEGLLRKITGIESQGGEIVIQTQFATISEAKPSGRISFTKHLKENLGKAKVIYKADGVIIKGIGNSRDDCDGPCEGLHCEWEKEIDDNVTLTGELDLDPTISLNISWHDSKLDTLIMSFTVTETFQITTTIDIIQIDLEKEITLLKLKLPPITIPASPPIVITPVITVKLGANLEINSELTAGVKQKLQIESGLKYIKSKVTPFYHVEKDLEPIPPELTNTLDAKAFVTPRIDMKVYQVISPYLLMEMYAKLEADLGATPWWVLYGGLNSRAGFKVSIWVPFIGEYTLLDKGVDLFDYKIPLADSEEGNHTPTADFTVSPDVGTIQTLFQFNASGCHDEEDDEEDLEVRWDFDGNGTWDTDWSTDKMASYQYATSAIYSAMLEVRDTDGDTDEMTKDVSVGFFADPRDGQTYNIIEIGGQIWFGKSLNYVTDSSYCYDHDPVNCNKYGRLYSWNVAKRACPDGWHLPTDEEWKVLESALDMPEDELDNVGYRGTDQGTQLKENGSSGFEALLSGWRSDVFGDFSDLEVKGMYWTGTSVSSTNVWYRELDAGETGVGRYQTLKINGLAIRCIKD
jgi:uncharacterized protein (TIGR02145 family)